MMRRQHKDEAGARYAQRRCDLMLPTFVAMAGRHASMNDIYAAGALYRHYRAILLHCRVTPRRGDEAAFTFDFDNYRA